MLYYIIIALALLFPLLWLKFSRGYSWKKVDSELFPKIKGFRQEAVGTIKLLAILLFAYFAVFAIISAASPFFESANLPKINDLDKVSQAIEAETSQLDFFLFSLVFSLFIEEFFFRAFLVKRIGPVWSTVVFAIAHISYGSIAEVIGVFVLGLILAYWYKKNNSLTQNYLAHLLYDLISIALYVI